MFDTFQLKSNGVGLMGYEWACESPSLVVCLIHGVGEHAGRYNRVANEFQKNNIATLAIDLRGHGCSVGKRGHIGSRSEVWRDIDNLVDAAEKKYNGVPIVIYGHSLGGNIVLEYRFRGQNSVDASAYIVTSPWLRLVQRIPRPLYRVVSVIDKVKPEYSLTSNFKPKMLGNVDLIMKEPAQKLNHWSISAKTAIEAYDVAEALSEGQIEDVFGGGEKPLLLMHGDKDPICHVEGSRQLAKREGANCTYIEWPDYLHELHNGHDDNDGMEVIEKILSWLEPYKRPTTEV